MLDSSLKMGDWLIPCGLTPEKEKVLSEIEQNMFPSFLLPSSLTPEKEQHLSEVNNYLPSSLLCRGRKALFQKFPEIVPCTEEIIKSSGFKAAAKRNSEVGCSVGVRLEDICDNLTAEIGALDSISRNTVRRLMEAPNKRFRAAEDIWTKSVVLLCPSLELATCMWSPGLVPLAPLVPRPCH